MPMKLTHKVLFLCCSSNSYKGKTKRCCSNAEHYYEFPKNTYAESIFLKKDIFILCIHDVELNR